MLYIPTTRNTERPNKSTKGGLWQLELFKCMSNCSLLVCTATLSPPPGHQDSSWLTALSFQSCGSCYWNGKPATQKSKSFFGMFNLVMEQKPNIKVVVSLFERVKCLCLDSHTENFIIQFWACLVLSNNCFMQQSYCLLSVFTHADFFLETKQCGRLLDLN